MKRTLIKTAAFALVLTASAIAVALGDSYSWANLQSDMAGVAEHTDRNLVNPWGMAVPGANGPIWVADNGTGVSTLYHLDGTVAPSASNPLVVGVPAREKNAGANPSGMVFNGTSLFKVTKNGNSQPSLFIFVNEDGTISGWNPALDATSAIVAVKGKSDNVYKGAALGVANGHTFLYATNFHQGRVDVYDESFQQVMPHSFVDSNIPKHFAPFGIRNINSQLYVTYAKQDEQKHDDVAGPGNGFIDVFDTSGNFIRRLVSNGNLNSPWGLALIEGDELWVGNFGDGFINNYDPVTGAFLSTISQGDGTPLQFDGLWDMLPLGGEVYFTAGIGGEGHGLFGIITED